MSTNNVEPQLSPYDPAYDAQKKQAANEQQADELLRATSKVNEYVVQPATYVKPKLNPYSAWGGSKKNEYNVCYKNVCYIVKADSLVEAAENGYMRMISELKNFSKKSIKISVQRRSKKRENHIYSYHVKREDIKNPKYKYKVTFTKIN